LSCFWYLTPCRGIIGVRFVTPEFQNVFQQSYIFDLERVAQTKTMTANHLIKNCEWTVAEHFFIVSYHSKSQISICFYQKSICFWCLVSYEFVRLY
jgi:hypothetical protein